MTTPKTDNSNERESAAQMYVDKSLREARAMLIEGEKTTRHIADHFWKIWKDPATDDYKANFAKRQYETLSDAIDRIDAAQADIQYVLKNEG